MAGPGDRAMRLAVGVAVVKLVRQVLTLKVLRRQSLREAPDFQTLQAQIVFYQKDMAGMVMMVVPIGGTTVEVLYIEAVVVVETLLVAVALLVAELVALVFGVAVAVAALAMVVRQAVLVLMLGLVGLVRQLERQELNPLVAAVQVAQEILVLVRLVKSLLLYFQHKDKSCKNVFLIAPQKSWLM
jgi:hypothetical protein